MTEWYRSWHGMVGDRLWEAIKARTDLPRHIIVAVWSALLEHASQADERGSVAEFDVETAALMLDLKQEQVETVLAALKTKGRVTESGRLKSWEKRQPLREDRSAERARTWRERKKEGVRNDYDPDPEPDPNLSNAPERTRTQATAPRRKDTRTRAKAPERKGSSNSRASPGQTSAASRKPRQPHAKPPVATPSERNRTRANATERPEQNRSEQTSQAPPREPEKDVPTAKRSAARAREAGRPPPEADASAGRTSREGKVVPFPGDRAKLWAQGPPLVMRMLGIEEIEARSRIGLWLQWSDEDAVRTLALICLAEAAREQNLDAAMRRALKPPKPPPAAPETVVPRADVWVIEGSAAWRAWMQIEPRRAHESKWHPGERGSYFTAAYPPPAEVGHEAMA